MSANLALRIEDFKEGKIGLERGHKVRLEAHNERWKRLYSTESLLLFDKLKIESLRLFHIGSTAVSSIVAKPIIDILGFCDSLEEFDRRTPIFEELGYEYRGEYGIEGRRYCVLCNQDKSMGFVHLHLFQKGDQEIDKHLAFRDRLRKSPDIAKKYEDLKKHLVEEEKTSRQNYTDSKNELIQEIIREALWSKSSFEKVTAVLGASPGHGNTLEFLKSQYSGENVEFVDLNEVNIAPHQYKAKSNDDFAPVVEKLITSDLIIFATPIYWYSMSSSMKNFFDRLADLLSSDQKQLGKKLYGKKSKLVATGSGETPPLGFEIPFVCTSLYFGMDYLGCEYKSTQA